MNGIYLTNGFNLDNIKHFSVSKDVFAHFKEPVLFYEDMEYVFMFSIDKIEPIGFYGIHKNGLLRYLYIEPFYRGKGFSWLMLKNIFSKYENISLTCKSSLIPFYVKHGFYVIKNYKQYAKLRYEKF